MISEIDVKDFADYQAKAWEFAQTSAKNPPYLYGNLAAEVGEVMSLWAKSIRDGADPVDYYQSLIKELGDCLWMISGIATYYNLSLEDIAEANIQKLADRKKRNTIQGKGDNR